MGNDEAVGDAESGHPGLAKDYIAPVPFALRATGSKVKKALFSSAI
jgi:hypothetical protein